MAVVLLQAMATDIAAVGKTQSGMAADDESAILKKIARLGESGGARKTYVVRWSAQMNFGGTGELRREYASHLSRELRRIHNVIPFELKSDYSKPIDVAFVLVSNIGEAANGVFRYFLDAVYSTPEEAEAAAQALSANERACFSRQLIVDEQILRAITFVSIEQEPKKVLRCISKSLLAAYGINTPNDEASVLNPNHKSGPTELTTWDLEALRVLYSYEGPLVLERKN